jgi:hypothetical protein
LDTVRVDGELVGPAVVAEGIEIDRDLVVIVDVLPLGQAARTCCGLSTQSNST